ncbi:hypothetical protein FN846DRAFT_911614 [Sphaerosporella brunnea]|uniref:Uncharacterized protein n=1 Tax=Sphaerosporella brunnea TaxID=1250544 RepID=A0A5J5EIN5_9PEZI|nr:hypothetical protein FN846DRAFT_911614 [Sphaerosporella brunnea]
MEGTLNALVTRVGNVEQAVKPEVLAEIIKQNTNPTNTGSVMTREWPKRKVDSMDASLNAGATRVATSNIPSIRRFCDRSSSKTPILAVVWAAKAHIRATPPSRSTRCSSAHGITLPRDVPPQEGVARWEGEHRAITGPERAVPAIVLRPPQRIDGTGDGNMVRCPRRKPHFADNDGRPQALKGVQRRVFMEKVYAYVTVDVSRGFSPICADRPNNRVVSKINQAGKSEEKKRGNAKTKVWSVPTLKNHFNMVHGWSLHCPFCASDRRVLCSKASPPSGTISKLTGGNGDSPWDGEMDSYLRLHFEQSSTEQYRRDSEDGQDGDEL